MKSCRRRQKRILICSWGWKGEKREKMNSADSIPYKLVSQLRWVKSQKLLLLLCRETELKRLPQILEKCLLTKTMEMLATLK